LKSQLIRLIIVLAVLAVLAGALCFFLLLPPKDGGGESSSAASSQAESVWSFPDGDISGLSVQNSEGSYAFTRLEDGSYQINGYDGLERNEAAYASLDAVLGLVKQAVISDPQGGYAQYGLDRPEITFSVKLKDGKSEALKIGAVSPDSTKTYAQTEGGGVFLVDSSALTSLKESPLYYIGKTVSPTTDNYSAVSVKSIIFGGTVREDKPIKLEALPEGEDALSSFAVEQDGFVMDANMTTIQQQINSALQLVASEIAIIKPADSELDGFGLKYPYSSMTVKYGEPVESDVSSGASSAETAEIIKSYTINVGGEESAGRRYVMLEGGAAIYVVPAEDIPWLEYKFTDLCTNQLFLPNIKTVSEFDVIDGDAVYQFKLAQDAEDETSVSIGGRALETESFRKFYQLLISGSGEDLVETPPAGAPIMEYIIKYHDAAKKDTHVRYIPIDDRNVAIELDGRVIYSIRTAYVTKVLESANIIANGGSLPTVDW
jgi:hypothetical protein